MNRRVVAVLAAFAVVFCVPSAASADGATDAAALMAKATKVQQEFLRASVAYDTATAQARQMQAAAEVAQQAATKATVQARSERDLLGQMAAEAYMTGSSPAASGMLNVVEVASDPRPDARLRAESDMTYVQDLRGMNVDDLLGVQREAERARDRAVLAADKARAAKAAAEAEFEAARERAVRLSTEIEAALAAFGDTGGLAGAQQEALNKVAEESWAGYLSTLKRVKVTPPKIAALSNPKRLPKGLSPLLTSTGVPARGVASAARGHVAVVSREAVTATSAAVAALRAPYTAGSAGPDSFDCGGLTSAVWAKAGVTFSTSPAKQWASGVRVAVKDAQPGDLVFMTAPGAGVQHVGVVVAPGLMVAASSETFTVAAAHIPAKPLGVIRPGLKAGKSNAVPARDPDSTMRCGSTNEFPVVTATKGTTGQSTGRAWGGYSNGMIPRTALCPIAPDEDLRCDAAAAFKAMNAAYAKQFKSGICVTDGYRAYADQVRLFKTSKPGFAAFPGTSTHGWALATDLGCGINQFGTPQYQWMKANAPAFGFTHPSWAEPGGRAPEPWHWEFGAAA